MKQHITEKQWDKLPQVSKQKMFLWQVEVGRDLNGRPAKLLDIGELIEYLGDDWYDKLFSIEYNQCAYIYPMYDDELIDALWSACKEKLKE